MIFDFKTIDVTENITIISGVFSDADQNKCIFTIVNDPAQVPVIVVVVIVASMASVALAELDTFNRMQTLSEAITACKERGGFPKLKIESTYGVSFSPFKLGCGAECTLECREG